MALMKLNSILNVSGFIRQVKTLSFSIFFLSVLVFEANAQTVGDYRSSGTGSWGTLATWQRYSGSWATPTVAQGYPGQNATGTLSTTTVTILSSHTITGNVSPALAISTLAFAVNTVNSTITMNTGIALTVTNAITFTVPTSNGVSQTVTVGGGSITCGSISMANLSGTRTNNVTVNSGGTLTVNGAITTAGSATENTVSLSGTAILNVAGAFTGGGFTVSNTGAPSAMSTVNWFGDNSNTIRSMTYGNLIVSIPATATANRTNALAGATTVNGNCTVQSLHATNTVSLDAAGFDFTVNGTTTLNARGNFTDSDNTGTDTFVGNVTVNAASSFITTSVTTASELDFQGGVDNSGTFSAGVATFDTNTQTLGGSGTMSFANAVAVETNSSLTGAGSISFANTVTPDVGVTLTNNNTGTVTVTNTGSIVLTGNITQGTNSTLSVASTTPFSGSGTFDATTNANTVNYSGAAQTVSAYNYNNLTLSGSGNKTAASGLTITGNFTLAAGTFIAGAFTHNVAGNWINNGGGFTSTGSTINLNGTTQTIGGTSATTFTNLALANSGTKTFNFATVIGGNFSISGTAKANLGTFTTHTANSLTLGGSAMVAGTWGGTGTAAHVNATYFTATAGFVTVASCGSAGTWFGTTSTNWNTGSNWCGNAVPIASTDVVIGPATNQPTINAASFSNNITINSGATLTIAASNSLTVSGNWTNNGTFTPNSNTTVTFNGASPTIGGYASTTFNNVTYSGAATATVSSVLSITGDLTVSTGTLNSSSNIFFTGTATQNINGAGAFNFTSVTMNTSGTNVVVNATSNISVSSNLSFSATPSASGPLVLGASTNLVMAVNASITGYNSTSYVQLDGSTGSNSSLIVTSNGHTSSWQTPYRIGTSSGGYTQLTLTTVATNPTNGATLAVKAIYNGSSQGKLRRVFRTIVSGNAAATTFTSASFAYNGATDVSTGDATANYTTVWYLPALSGSWASVTGTSTGTSPFTITASTTLGNGTNYYTIGQASAYPSTWYSYQTGVWSNWLNWTSDPSGASLINGLNSAPQPGDQIVILTGITIQNDVAGQVVSTTTINAGGTLDMSNTTGNTLGTVSGGGLLRIGGATASVAALPGGTYASFTTAVTGGTIEYYNATVGTYTLPTGQTTYNNLILSTITSAVTFVETNNLIINGNFTITSSSSGTVTWQINDATGTNRTISIAGDLTVSSNGKITAGTGNSGSTTQHSLTLSGSLTNNGTIQFFDPTDASYALTSGFPANSVYTQGYRGNAVNVTFSGTTDATVTCNGQTDFYRFIVNKGTGQQAKVTVNSSAAGNMRLFGPAKYTNLALLVTNGTLQLTGTLTIPSLIESVNNTLSTDLYNIAQTAAIWLNSPGVNVTLTKNINANNDDQRLAVNGLFRASNGSSFNAGFSRGIGSASGGSVIIEGSNTTVTAWQLRPIANGTGIFTYYQTGGTLNVGTTGYNGTPATAGPDDGITGPNNYTDEYARFSLGNATSAFQMSGGVINIGSPTTPSGGGGALAGGIDIQSLPANYNVTGGTINMYIPRNTSATSPSTSPSPASGSHDFTIYSTAPLYNVNIYREGTTDNRTAILNRDLVVQGNLAIITGNTPTLNVNNKNLTIGGNFDIQTGTTFTASTTSTITFNGSGSQAVNYNGTITANTLGTVVMNKSAGTLTFPSAASTGSFTVATYSAAIPTLTLTSGTLADGGKKLEVTTALTNNATHTSTGSGSITYTATNGVIGGNNGTFGNLILLPAASSIATLSGNQAITNSLQLNSSGGTSSILNIGSNSLTVGTSSASAAAAGSISTSNGAGFTASYCIQTSALHNAGGLTRYYFSGTPLTFPVGFASGGTNYYSPYQATITGATTYSNITVRPVNSEHPNVTTPAASLKFYWRVTSSGFNLTGATIKHSCTIASVTQFPNGTNGVSYNIARYDRTANTWAYTTSGAQTMTTAILPNPFETGTPSGLAWSGLSAPASSFGNPSNSDWLDGEYTCGNGAFNGTLNVFYAITAVGAPGLWNANTTWSYTSSTGSAVPAGSTAGTNFPAANSPVVIGDASNNRGVIIDQNSRSCGSLSIGASSVLDCSTFVSLNFGTSTGGSISGTGTVRLESPNFPAGDFTNFIGTAGGTVEYYSGAGSGWLSGALTTGSTGLTGTMTANKSYTNISQSSTNGSGLGALFTVVIGTGNAVTSITATTPGTGYASADVVSFNATLFGATGGTVTGTMAAANLPGFVIPTTGPGPQNLALANYYNLVLNPASGTAYTIYLPASNLNIYNNFTEGSNASTGTAQTNGSRTISVTGNLSISAGTFNFSNVNPSVTTLTVGGNTTVANGAIMKAQGAGTANISSFSTSGNITNNGTMNFNNTAVVNLTFTGTSAQTFSGSGANTFNTVTVNKGTSQSPTLTFSSSGALTTTAIAGGWLTLTNGTFDFEYTGTPTATTILTTSTYTIPSTTKLKVGQGTIQLGSTNTAGNDLLLSGTLEIGNSAGGNGTLYTFSTTAAGSNGIDIEYAAAGTPTINVLSGALLVDGAVRRSTSTLTGALVYNQTGGAVTVGGNNPSAARGIFEIDFNTGSSFTMSGNSSLTIQRPTAGTGTFADIYLNPVSSSVSASAGVLPTITIGLANTNNNFKLNAAPTLGNLTINSGNTAAGQNVTLYSNDLVLAGTLTLNTNGTLQTTSASNNYDVYIAGNLSGAGTYFGAANTTTFNGAAAQSANLTTTSTFNNLTISNTGGSGAAGTVTLSGTAPTSLNNLNILSGVLDVGAMTLPVSGNITNNSKQISTGGAGAIAFASAATAHTITSSNGIFNNLSLGVVAAAPATKLITVSGNMTITGTLDFTTNGTSRYLFIGSGLLTFQNGVAPDPVSTATILNAGSARFIKTNGVSSDQGVKRNWSATTTSFTYAVGTRTNYTPVAMSSFTVTAPGNLTVVPVDGIHPTASPDGSSILDYYWKVISDNSFSQSNNTGSIVFTVATALIGGSSGTINGYYLDATNLVGWAQGSPNTPPPVPYTTDGTYAGGVFTLNKNLVSGNPVASPAIPPACMPAAGGEFDYTFGTSTNMLNPIAPLYSRFGATCCSPSTITESWSAAGGTSWTTSSTGYGAVYGSVPAGRPMVILPNATINLDASGQTAFSTKINGTLAVSTTAQNIGTVTGTGTLKATVNKIPAGTYTSFTSTSGGTIEYAAAVTMDGVTTNTYNYLKISAAGVVMTAANLTINSDLTITTGSSLDDATNGADATKGGIALAGNFANSGTFTGGTSTPIGITGNLVNTGIFNANSSVIGLTGNLQNTGGTFNGGSGTVNLTGNLQNTGTFNGGSGTVNLAGSFSNGGTFSAGTGTVKFNGTAPQTITGATTFNNLTINNTSGTSPQVSISSGNQTVNSTLTLTAGNINLNATTMTLGTSSCSPAGTLSLGSTPGWVYGTGGIFKRYFSASTTVNDGNIAGYFPVGNQSDYRPFYIGIPNGDMTTCASFSVGVNPATTTSIVNITDNSTGAPTPIALQYQGYWSVSTSAADGNYDLIAGGTGFGIIGSLNDLSLSLSGSVVGNYIVATGSTSDPRLTRTSIQFANIANNFYVGSTNAPRSPLPIELLSFTGDAKNYGVDLHWQTASEMNNDYFTVFRSASGASFESIGTVDGNGTTNSPHSYALVDYKPLLGKNYYQLKQTDFDGHITTSETIVVDVLSLDPLVSIYPNPLSQNQLLNVTVNGLAANSPTEIEIVNVQGTTVNGATLNTDADGSLNTSIALTGLSAGLYILKIQNVHYKFVIE